MLVLNKKGSPYQRVNHTHKWGLQHDDFTDYLGGYDYTDINEQTGERPLFDEESRSYYALLIAIFSDLSVDRAKAICGISSKQIPKNGQPITGYLHER